MLNLSCRQLPAVLTIAEKTNLSRAAIALSMSQPANGIDIHTSCEAGTCGTCKARYLNRRAEIYYN